VACQYTEQTAEATTLILHSEATLPTQTIGIAINGHIQQTCKELEQCLKAVEQQLEHAKNRNAAACRLTQPSKIQPQTQPPAKDKGASTAGATTKK
jgi:hypothetical protein